MTPNYSEQILSEYTPLIINMLIYLLVLIVLSVVFRAFICAAINSDAKARGVKERTLYTVLSFFFPLIVGIVYLCTRKSCKKIQPKICNHCHTTVDTNSTFCPNCLGTDFTDYLIQNNEKYHKKSTAFLIVGIVIYVITCVINVSFNVYFQKNIEPLINDAEKYSNYFDNYGNEDNDNSDDFDADDFFKQFEMPQDGDEGTMPDELQPDGNIIE